MLCAFISFCALLESGYLLTARLEAPLLRGGRRAVPYLSGTICGRTPAKGEIC